MTRALLAIVAVGMFIPAASCSRPAVERSEVQRPRAEAPETRSTSRDGLADTVRRSREALTKNPADERAAIALSDALLRQTRVSNNASLSVEASSVLQAVLRTHPERDDVRRMLAATYLSLHKFREALNEARRCQAASRGDDSFLLGIIGDASLELGEYDDAFAAFDRMNRAKPTAASYARASYAREIQGDLPGALRLMQMALEATPPQDVESLAWHHAQIGHLFLELDRLSDAKREYEHADYVFPGHPFASDGLARVADATGNPEGALAIVSRRIAEAPLPADFAFAGDLLTKLGRRDEAERHYRLAEAAWRSDVPEPSRLARFLAERDRHLDEALQIAEQAYRERRDIFSADALAWALFKNGDIDRAAVAIAEATRTGTRDRAILGHAAAITKATGQKAVAAR